MILVSSPDPRGLYGPCGAFGGLLDRRLGFYFGRRLGSPPGLPGGGITRIVPAPASGVG